MHFVGVAGSGVGALARFRRGYGLPTSGSDRLFDQGREEATRRELEQLGIAVHPQDGSGVVGASLVVSSTAVEASIADLIRAKKEGVPILHRAALLAHHMGSRDSIGIAGSSGKSTTTALVASLLRRLGRDPGLICGAEVLDAADGQPTASLSGKGPLVAELDESDGSLVRHQPTVGVILNLHRDHMEEEAILDQFQSFSEGVRGPVLISDDPALEELRPRAKVFGFGPDAEFRGRGLQLDPEGSRFEVLGQRVAVKLPGRHNASNALAALAALDALGIPPRESAPHLGSCLGVARRFQRVGSHRGVRIIDDYAHNPAKVAAALAAARLRGGRMIAFFQPHGFKPTLFNRDGFIRAFAGGLGRDDQLFIATIYYAGGSVSPEISSEDLAREIAKRGVQVESGDREAFRESVGSRVEPGDVVLLMGARDPSLGGFAASILQTLSSEGRA